MSFIVSKKLFLSTLVLAGFSGLTGNAQNLADSPAAPPPAVQEKENPAKRAGDEAFAAKDYAVAVSFYTKLLEECIQKKDPQAIRDAYERLLDALVLGKMPDLAEKYLERYRADFPNASALALAMWKGDILTQKGEFENAKKLYERILPDLGTQDPRRLRTLFSYGTVLEKIRDYAAAAKIYDTIRQQAGASPIGKTAFEQMILCIASNNRPERALELLMENPPDSSSQSAAYNLLTAYILLKRDGVETTSGAWMSVMNSLKDERDPLTYLVASSYGDAFLEAKEYSLALESYRAAFRAASEKKELFDTLTRMISVISSVGDKNKAAALAVSQLELFKNSLLTPEVKLRTARLLQESGNPKGALELYESVFANMNSSDAEKFEALREYALLMGRLDRFPEAAKTVRTHFRNDNEVLGEFLLGEVLVALENSEQFITVYEDIARRWPKEAPKALFLAASACLDARESKKALEFIARLRKLPLDAKTSADLLYIEAAARGSTEKTPEVLQIYDEFMRKAPKDDPLLPKALYHSGALAMSMKDMKSAAKRFSRLIHDYPSNPLAPQASYWLIHTYYCMNDEISAERETWLLAERFPNSLFAVDAMFKLATHYADAGVGTKAEAALGRLAKDNRYPRVQARALYELALQAYRRGDSAAALKRLDELYEKFPETPSIADAYYLHADILRARSDFQAAIPFYRKAAEARPDSPVAWAATGSVGDCLLAIASPDRSNSKNELLSAIRAYRDLMDAPRCPPQFEAMALYRTGRCFELLDKQDSAVEQYKKLLYRFPAARAVHHPTETVWCVRAAEALIDIAARHPLRPAMENARFALHWLSEANLITRAAAAERFEKLKKVKFNP